MLPFDPDRLWFRSPLAKGQVFTQLHVFRPIEGEKYLRGPIPINWLSAAAQLPGKSLYAGVAHWFNAGLARSPRVSVSNLSGGKFSLDRNAKYRALVWLGGAGLVRVERKLGRIPVVAILAAKPPS